MSLELELRERRWLLQRTVVDRADVLVIHRRAEALLLLARTRMTRVSWSAWLASEAEASCDGESATAVAPTQRVRTLVHAVEGLARGDAFYSGAYSGGERLAMVEELAEVLGLDRDDLDAKTHEIGRRIDKMLEEAMARMRAATAPEPREDEGADARRRAPPPSPPPTLPTYVRAVYAFAQLPTWQRGLVHPARARKSERYRAKCVSVEGRRQQLADAGLEAMQSILSERNLVIVRKALSGVARVDGRYSIPVVADLLIGRRSGCLKHAGLDRVRTFGALAGHQREWVVDVLVLCAREGLVEGLKLTDEGREVMRGTRSAELMLPDEEPLGAGWEPAVDW